MKKIIFMGTPAFAATVLEGILADGGYQVLAVVTQPDRAVGRILVVERAIGFLLSNALALAVELLHQLQHGALMLQRDQPLCKTRAPVMQFQVAHTAMILQAQALIYRQSPFTPLLGLGIAGQQTLLGQGQQAAAELQIRTQVNRDDG